MFTTVKWLERRKRRPATSHEGRSSWPLFAVIDCTGAGAPVDSTALGIAAGTSTIAHEIPQELGEFSVYVKSGYSRRRALLLNGMTSLASLLGAGVGYLFLSQMRSIGPYLLAFAAAGFRYVALADLVPAQRGATSLGSALADLSLVGLRITVIAVFAHAH